MGVAGEWKPVTLRSLSRIVPFVGAGECTASPPDAGELRGERLELAGREMRRPEVRMTTGVSLSAMGTCCDVMGGEVEVSAGEVEMVEVVEVVEAVGVAPGMGKGAVGVAVVVGAGELGREDASLCTGE